MARPCPRRQCGLELFGGVGGGEEKSGAHPEGGVHSGDDVSQVSCKPAICMLFCDRICRRICCRLDTWREQQFRVIVLICMYIGA